MTKKTTQAMPTTVHKRTYTVLSLFALTLFVSNGWLLWEGNIKKINPFPFLADYHLSVQWYAHEICGRLAYVVFTCAFFPLVRMNQALKAGVIIVLIYFIEDVIAYFLTASTISYTIILSVLIMAACFVLYFIYRIKTPHTHQTLTLRHLMHSGHSSHNWQPEHENA